MNPLTMVQHVKDALTQTQARGHTHTFKVFIHYLSKSQKSITEFINRQQMRGDTYMEKMTVYSKTLMDTHLSMDEKLRSELEKKENTRIRVSSYEITYTRGQNT